MRELEELLRLLVRIVISTRCESGSGAPSPNDKPLWFIQCWHYTSSNMINLLIKTVANPKQYYKDVLGVWERSGVDYESLNKLAELFNAMQSHKLLQSRKVHDDILFLKREIFLKNDLMAKLKHKTLISTLGDTSFQALYIKDTNEPNWRIKRSSEEPLKHAVWNDKIEESSNFPKIIYPRTIEFDFLLAVFSSNEFLIKKFISDGMIISLYPKNDNDTEDLQQIRCDHLKYLLSLVLSYNKDIVEIWIKQLLAHQLNQLSYNYWITILEWSLENLSHSDLQKLQHEIVSQMDYSTHLQQEILQKLVCVSKFEFNNNFEFKLFILSKISKNVFFKNKNKINPVIIFSILEWDSNSTTEYTYLTKLHDLLTQVLSSCNGTNLLCFIFSVLFHSNNIDPEDTILFRESIVEISISSNQCDDILLFLKKNLNVLDKIVTDWISQLPKQTVPKLFHKILDLGNKLSSSIIYEILLRLPLDFADQVLLEKFIQEDLCNENHDNELHGLKYYLAVNLLHELNQEEQLYILKKHEELLIKIFSNIPAGKDFKIPKKVLTNLFSISNNTSANNLQENEYNATFLEKLIQYQFQIIFDNNDLNNLGTKDTICGCCSHVIEICSDNHNFRYIIESPLISSKRMECLKMLSGLNSDACRKFAIKILSIIFNLNSDITLKLTHKFCSDKGISIQEDVGKTVFESSNNFDSAFCSVLNIENQTCYPSAEKISKLFNDLTNSAKEFSAQNNFETHNIEFEKRQSNYPLFRNRMKHKDRIPDSTGMVITKTVQNNIFTIIEVIDNPTINLLVEGNTGIGKTATIVEACHLIQVPLIRFNMSDRITIKDFFGKVDISSKNGAISFEFCAGPFTQAFANGYWLLIDEVNLASPSVLEAIENAIDTGVLSVSDDSDAENREKKFEKHSNFRLFVTQNPATGLFAGHRKRLPESFASRLHKHVFQALPANEWKEIVKAKLKEIPSISEKDLLHFSNVLVDDHLKIEQILADDTSFSASLFTLTIREMLRWCNGIKNLVADGCKISDAFYHEAIGIYLGRFTKKNNYYLSIEQQIFKNREINMELNFKVQGGCTIISAGPYSVKSNDISSNKKIDRIKASVSSPIFDMVYDIHMTVYKFITTTSFIEKYGLQPVGTNIFILAIRKIADTQYCDDSDLDESKFFILEFYLNLFRNENARQLLLNEFISKKICVEGHAKSLKDNFLSWPISSPLIISPRIKRCFSNIIRAISLHEPILLIGKVGTGKTKIINTLARTLGIKCNQFYLTADTDPSELVGQVDPKTLQWKNGIVTSSIEHEEWVILDNLDEAESVLLERLNPLLEADPYWVLSEKGETTKIPIGKNSNFRFFATVCPESFSEGSKSKNSISPALANRFTIIHMDDFEFSNNVDTCDTETEIKKLAENSFPCSIDNLSKAYTSCLKFSKENLRDVVTPRHFAKLLDCAFEIKYGILNQNIENSLSNEKLFCISFNACIVQLLGNTEESKKLKDIFFNGLNMKDYNLEYDFNFIDYVTNTAKLTEAKEYIIHPGKTPSRYNFAEVVALYITCNQPILMQGPPACGKTALVEVIDKFSPSTRGKLLRVNNTETTTIQDYFGSYVPVANEKSSQIPKFIFRPGDLTIALRDGRYFLADELNLADSAIISAIAPILEGNKTINIPNTSLVINVHPDFRFFATQNSAETLGRTKLPKRLRNLFLEVLVDEVPYDELKHMISMKFSNLISEEEASSLQTLYMKVNNAIEEQKISFGDKSIKLTMREITKIVHRYNRNVKPKLSLELSIYLFLYPRFRDDNHLSYFTNILKNIYPTFVVPVLDNMYILEDKVKASEKQTLTFYSSEPNSVPLLTFHGTTANCPLIRDKLAVPTFIRKLFDVINAWVCGEPILLLGPTSCKSELINVWKQLTNVEKLDCAYLTSETESSDLIGQIRPFQSMDAGEFWVNNCFKLFSERLLRLGANGDQLIVNEMDQLQNQISEIHTSLNTIKQSVEENKASVVPTEEVTDNTMDKEENETVFEVTPFPQEEDSTPLWGDTPFSFAVDPFEQDPFGESLLNESMDDNPFGELYNNPFEGTNDNPFGAMGENPFGETDENPFKEAEDNPFGEMSENPFGETDENPFKETEDNPFDMEDDPFGNINQNPFAEIQKNPFEMDAYSSLVRDNPLLSSNEHPLSMLNDPSFNFEEEEVDERKIDEYFNLLDSDSFNKELSKTFNELFDDNSIANDILQNLFKIAEKLNDNGLTIICNTMEKIREQLKSASLGEALFLYHDGKITSAAKHGRPILLENIDLPPQAVVERINSLLEFTRSFALTEDFTLQNEFGKKTSSLSNTIELLPSFSVFTTIYVPQVKSQIKLSPAIRSRLTEIWVPPLDLNEQILILKQSLEQHSSVTSLLDCSELAHFTFDVIAKAKQQSVEVTIRDVINITKFMKVYLITIKDRNDIKLLIKTGLFLAIQFFILDKAPVSKRDYVKKQITDSNYEYAKIITGLNIGKPIDPLNAFFWDAKSNCVCLSHVELFCPVVVPYLSNDDFNITISGGVRLNENGTIRQKFTPLQATQTMIENVERLIASIIGHFAPLLIGPPGIGKTAIITYLANLLGKNIDGNGVARINFSESTTKEQLFGSYIPKVIDGKRSFQWTDGSVVRALRNGNWIIFDEINLAPPEVLEEITHLLISYGATRSEDKYIYCGTEVLKIPDETIIFATMNPRSIGGGRGQLPRSLDSHLISITLDALPKEEVHLIGLKLAEASLVHNETELGITEQQLFKLFEIQSEFHDKVTNREIGYHGGPFEFNLRDLELFFAILQGNANYYMLSGGDIESIKASQLRSIQLFAQIAFAMRLQSITEQTQGCEIINRHLGIQDTDNIINNTLFEKISSTKDFVQIGNVVLPIKDANIASKPQTIVHTQNAIKRMQYVATAMQSKKCILLEGPTCSAKTSLVIELARLCGKKLVIISMNDDTEVADMMGQYAAVSGDRATQNIISKLKDLIDSTIQLCITSIISIEPNIEILKGVTELCRDSENDENLENDEDKNSSQQDLLFNHYKTISYKALSILKSCESIAISDLVLVQIIGILRDEIDKTVKEYKVIHAQNNDGLNFQFAEGEFINAIRCGDWVLLDNINRARGEVVERINSLLESDSILYLTEKGSGEILRKNEGIHPEFQLFATSTTSITPTMNSNNELSPAFKNRVCRLWFPNIDAISNEIKIEEHELLNIGVEILNDYPGIHYLILPLLKLHFTAKEIITNNRLEKEIVICARTYFQAILMFKNILRRASQDSVEVAFANVIHNLYIKLFPDVHQKLLLSVIPNYFKHNKMNSTQLESSLYKFDLNRLVSASLTNLQNYFMEVEEIYIRLIFSLLVKNSKMKAKIDEDEIKKNILEEIEGNLVLPLIKSGKMDPKFSIDFWSKIKFQYLDNLNYFAEFFREMQTICNWDELMDEIKIESIKRDICRIAQKFTSNFKDFIANHCTFVNVSDMLKKFTTWKNIIDSIEKMVVTMNKYFECDIPSIKQNFTDFFYYESVVEIISSTNVQNRISKINLELKSFSDLEDESLRQKLILASAKYQRSLENSLQNSKYFSDTLWDAIFSLVKLCSKGFVKEIISHGFLLDSESKKYKSAVITPPCMSNSCVDGTVFISFAQARELHRWYISNYALLELKDLISKLNAFSKFDKSNVDMFNESDSILSELNNINAIGIIVQENVNILTNHLNQIFEKQIPTLHFEKGSYVDLLERNDEFQLMNYPIINETMSTNTNPHSLLLISTLCMEQFSLHHKIKSNNGIITISIVSNFFDTITSTTNKILSKTDTNSMESNPNLGIILLSEMVANKRRVNELGIGAFLLIERENEKLLFTLHLVDLEKRIGLFDSLISHVKQKFGTFLLANDDSFRYTSIQNPYDEILIQNDKLNLISCEHVVYLLNQYFDNGHSHTCVVDFLDPEDKITISNIEEQLFALCKSKRSAYLENVENNALSESVKCTISIYTVLKLVNELKKILTNICDDSFGNNNALHQIIDDFESQFRIIPSSMDNLKKYLKSLIPDTLDKKLLLMSQIEPYPFEVLNTIKNDISKSPNTKLFLLNQELFKNFYSTLQNIHGIKKTIIHNNEVDTTFINQWKQLINCWIQCFESFTSSLDPQGVITSNSISILAYCSEQFNEICNLNEKFYQIELLERNLIEKLKNGYDLCSQNKVKKNKTTTTQNNYASSKEKLNDIIKQKLKELNENIDNIRTEYTLLITDTNSEKLKSFISIRINNLPNIKSFEDLIAERDILQQLKNANKIAAAESSNFVNQSRFKPIDGNINRNNYLNIISAITDPKMEVHPSLTKKSKEIKSLFNLMTLDKLMTNYFIKSSTRTQEENQKALLKIIYCNFLPKEVTLSLASTQTKDNALIDSENRLRKNFIDERIKFILNDQDIREVLQPISSIIDSSNISLYQYIDFHQILEERENTIHDIFSELKKTLDIDDYNSFILETTLFYFSDILLLLSPNCGTIFQKFIHHEITFNNIQKWKQFDFPKEEILILLQSTENPTIFTQLALNVISIYNESCGILKASDIEIISFNTSSEFQMLTAIVYFYIFNELFASIKTDLVITNTSLDGNIDEQEIVASQTIENLQLELNKYNKQKKEKESELTHLSRTQLHRETSIKNAISKLKNKIVKAENQLTTQQQKLINIQQKKEKNQKTG